MPNSGIYVVRLLNTEPMPVTRDPRYVETCAKVTCANVKVGKARDFDERKANYYHDFDECNVEFTPILKTDEQGTLETEILRKLRAFRKISPRGGRLEWLEGIDAEQVIEIILTCAEESGIAYEKLI